MNYRIKQLSILTKEQLLMIAENDTLPAIPCDCCMCVIDEAYNVYRVLCDVDGTPTFIPITQIADDEIKYFIFCLEIIGEEYPVKIKTFQCEFYKPNFVNFYITGDDDEIIGWREKCSAGLDYDFEAQRKVLKQLKQRFLEDEE